jgi:hypothetical protein
MKFYSVPRINIDGRSLVRCCRHMWSGVPMNLHHVIALLLFLVCYNVEAEQIELVGVGEFPGTASDLSGQQDRLENGEPHNRLGGFSALEYSGNAQQYVALPDRGPDDGATGYLCRYQLLDINVQPGAAEPVILKLVDSILFKDCLDRPFTGASNAFAAGESIAERLDPEGFRFGKDGTFYVSDEYGPQLIQFSAMGKELKRFQLPEHLMVENPAESKVEENELNDRGRSSNKGMEGLAISSNHQHLYGIMQHVLIQDGERDEIGKPVGVNCRLVVIHAETGQTREFVYQLDDRGNGLNEILAINDRQFLVIERDGLIGTEAKFKKIMKIDLTGATEIQDEERLPAAGLPDHIRPVGKQVFIDFLSPEYKLSAAQIPEKLEGLTFGQPLEDGRATLIVSSDNDFNADAPSLIYVFALPKSTPVESAVSAK